MLEARALSPQFPVGILILKTTPEHLRIGEKRSRENWV